MRAKEDPRSMRAASMRDAATATVPPAGEAGEAGADEAEADGTGASMEQVEGGGRGDEGAGKVDCMTASMAAYWSHKTGTKMNSGGVNGSQSEQFVALSYVGNKTCL